MRSVIQAGLPVALMLGCVACTPQAPEPVTSREVSQNEIDAAGPPEVQQRPSFALDDTAALDAIAKLGTPWSTQPFLDDARPDSLTGGYYHTLGNSGGSSDVFTLPNGRVWRVNLRVGVGERCGQPSQLEAAFSGLLAIVAPKAELDANTKVKLAKALRTRTGEDADLVGVNVKMSGGCVAALSLTAR